MKHNFIIRIHKSSTTSSLGFIQSITLSNITIISKPNKFNGLCLHQGNQKKYGYSIEIVGKFNAVSGSNSSPTISFKGDYIDIIFRNFPRYPAFYQDNTAARNYMEGWKYTNYVNDGFTSYLLCRNIEIRRLLTH
jgi:hypothetical protein